MRGILDRLRRRGLAPASFGPIDVSGRVYAVGDIHGRADLLLKLLELMMQDAADLGAPPEIVFLGDYIDRGDNSFEVIEALTAVAQWPEIRPVFLMGNHEDMLLEFLERPESGSRWLRYGGLQTLMSYGISGFESLQNRGELTRLRDLLVERLAPHMAFLQGLRLSHRNGNVLFAHAGAEPRESPEEQSEAALLWGAPGFLSETRRDGIWVCHGHTIVDDPEMAEGRISIDTGAFFSGRLTAVRLGDEPPRFMVADDFEDRR